MKNKAFTLIELLAVIIILGVLLLITIPSVTSFIKESKEQTYVTTLNNFIKAARELVDTDKISMNDKNTTYYIPKSCLKVDKESESPFGKWEDVYVAVTYDGTNHKYYISAKDETEHGVELCPEVELKIERLRSDLKDLSNMTLLGDTKNIYRVNANCVTGKTLTEEDILDEQNDFDAVFMDGYNINIKMKKLASSDPDSYELVNSSIKRIKFSSEEPGDENKQKRNVVSANGSPMPIYMWFDDTDGTIYWWSEDRKPSLNQNCRQMFYHLNGLVSIDEFYKFDSSNVTDVTSMFIYCHSLETLDLSNFDTHNITTMNSFLDYCNTLKYVDVSGFDTSNVTNFNGMFSLCQSLEYVDVSGFDTSNATNIGSMFSYCYNLKSIDVSGFDTSNVTIFSSIFSYCKKLQYVDVSHFDTSKATTMCFLFNSCYELTSVDISNFQTSNVTDMREMFCACSKMETIDVSSLDTSNVTQMDFMFDDCTALKTIDLSNFDTSKVTSFHCMFGSCSNLEILDLSSFNTSSATTMWGMFCYCKKLREINLTSFNTTSLTCTYGMFDGCTELVSLDLSSFNTSALTNAARMFQKCIKLKTIYVSNNFVLNNATNYATIFENNYELVGGAGTVWNSSMNNDKTYARIDGGTSSPGLFTLKTV